jgi:RimJ/RimL family protein N-acetyltransferase
MPDNVNINVSIRALSIEESLLIRDAQRPASGWAPDFPTDDDVRVTTYFANLAPSPTSEQWTTRWLIVECGVVVGMLGFKGEPLGNVLEVGYGVAPSGRGRGVATAALAQLLDGIKLRGLKVRAETAVWNVPSQSVLRHLHFKEIGRRNDPGDGDLIVWELFAD